MSRAAASKAAKEMGKANKEIKDAQKAREKELGLTGDIKRAIGTDVLLCKDCGATQMGPTVCECKGGKVRPPPGDDGLAELIAAAKVRLATVTAARIKESNLSAGAVAKDRAKRKEDREADANDMNAEFQGDGTDVLVNVEFAVGKLGMEIEKNAVSKLTEGQAEGLKVVVGWIIHKVGGDPVEPNKKAIGKAIMAGMKKGPVVLAFRTPITEGFHHCVSCDKFIDAAEYEEDQLGKGPGVQMCAACAEIADMAGDYDD